MIGCLAVSEKKNPNRIMPSLLKRVLGATLGLVTAQTEWSYLCLGTKHGCVLTQHEASASLGLYRSVRHVVTTPCSPVPLSPDPARSCLLVYRSPPSRVCRPREVRGHLSDHRKRALVHVLRHWKLRPAGAGCGVRPKNGSNRLSRRTSSTFIDHTSRPLVFSLRSPPPAADYMSCGAQTSSL